MKNIAMIMGLWVEGYYSAEEVISWADDQIRSFEGSPPDSLIELSLKGPEKCMKISFYEFPEPKTFSFLEIFSIKMHLLEMNSEESIKQFISWISSESMGEDLSIPEVSFGYQLEHRLSYDEGCPIQYLEQHINEFIPSSIERLKELTKQLKKDAPTSGAPVSCDR